jgi:hypothetical protein
MVVFKLYSKGSFEDVWAFFFVMQTIFYLDIYDIPMPANAEIYIEHFTNLIEFDNLNPFYYIRLANKKFTFSNWITGTDSS